MFPQEILPGIDMYLIMLCLAGIAAIVTYRICADKLKIGARLQNICLFDAVIAIFLGYCSAVLFQAFYNIKENGGLVINSSTGATFYGGLIGGAAVFLLVYFVAGRAILGKGGEHVKRIWSITDIGACSIAIAHSLGRIGCLMAGCCHGRETDAWYGIYMSSIGKRVVPLQLYEALVLLAIFVLLIWRLLRGKTYNLPIYMSLYGVWRFFIEYARNDYRGQTLVSFMTPSQLTAVLMVIGAGVVLCFEYRYVKRKNNVEEI